MYVSSRTHLLPQMLYQLINPGIVILFGGLDKALFVAALCDLIYRG